jgi:hypothetical protein
MCHRSSPGRPRGRPSALPDRRIYGAGVVEPVRDSGELAASGGPVISGARVLVTGASGLFGAALAGALAEGNEVVR